MFCVYKLFSKDPEVKDFYIGSTTDLRQRKYKHGYNFNDVTKNKNKLYTFILNNGTYENWDFEILHEEIFTDLKNQRIKEQEFIKLLCPSLNGKDEVVSREDGLQKKRIYNKIPEVRAKETEKQRERRKNRTEEEIEKDNAKQRESYHKKMEDPELRKKLNEYANNPEVLEKKQEYRNKPERKDAIKEYNSLESTKQKKKEYANKQENKDAQKKAFLERMKDPEYVKMRSDKAKVAYQKKKLLKELEV